MEWHDLIWDGYSRSIELLEKALSSLTVEDLNWQPKPDCNSLGWTVWHLSRGQDAEISGLMEDEQLWIKDKWYKKFNRPLDANDTGFGHTPEQVKAFKSPPAETLLDYHRAVLGKTKSYVYTLSKSELDKELNEPWFQPLPTVGIRLVSVMIDGAEHCGEIAYLRGLYKGYGWLGA